MIFYNLYFYLFLTLFFMHFILKRVLKKHHLFFDTKKQISDIEFLSSLDKGLKNNNSLFADFILILYFIIIITLFFVFCIKNICIFNQVKFASCTNLDFFNQLLCFMLCLIYFFKILNYIIYPYILKKHYYLFHTYEKYSDFVMLNNFLREPILYNYFSKITSFFFKLIEKKKDFVNHYKNLRNLYSKLHQEDLIRKEFLFYLSLRYFINKSYGLKLLCNILFKIFGYFKFHISRFFYYLPHSLVVICLFYDISNGVIYYTFYALLYFYITNMTKKIRKFYTEKDPVYDNLLSKFFYNNSKEYDDILKALKENLTKYLGTKEHLQNILYHKEELINYINSDYKVYYFLDVTRSNTEKYIENIYKRLHLILLLLLFNIYIIYYNKYILICYNVNINLYFISILILCILYFIHRKIAEELPEYWVEHKTPKQYFYIIVIFYIIICSYLFLRNKLGLEFIEILCDYNNIVIIKENFTLTEKYKYVENYISQLQKETSVDWDLLEYIKIKIKNELTLTPDRTLEEIKLMINSIYESINQQYEKEIQAFNWYEWLKTQIKNKKS